jgi:argininosuccinate lyase
MFRRIAASAAVLSFVLSTAATAQTAGVVNPPPRDPSRPSAPAAPPAAPRGPGHDAFYWLSQVNKASAVMVTETGIVPPALGKTIAVSVAQVIADADAKPALRSGDYLAVEPLMIAVGGPDVTRLHSGRSRQDIGATTRRLTQREQLLTAMDSLSKARQAILDLAAKNPDAIVPAYTWGVQAQPVSFGHWMLAYTEALQRDAQRLKNAYAATNMSPLGAAALGTSSFPVDRKRLAQLLGFDGVIENSLDANQVSPIDTGVDIVGVAASTALVVSTLCADIEAQYRMATPFLVLTEGELTSISSIMPQKRNPSSLQAIRITASDTVGDAQTFFLKSHNVPAGMGDYKGGDPEEALRDMGSMFDQLAAMVGELNFNAKRAAEEVAADWSATTELADTLQREGGVPFRVGHDFASDLVEFGRANGYKPAGIKYADAQRIFVSSAARFGFQNTKLPLDEKTFKRVLTAENMVAVSKGMGGPQPAEVARMMADQRAALAADRAWTMGRRTALDDATKARDVAFEKIRIGA